MFNRTALALLVSYALINPISGFANDTPAPAASGTPEIQGTAKAESPSVKHLEKKIARKKKKIEQLEKKLEQKKQEEMPK